ncbi:MAG TPA: CocE/NonD family hydrolase [Bryobacteraceae bacterium]|nr:CocE/NonD family hydrolase [Bryobacteraceae bacterium]
MRLIIMFAVALSFASAQTEQHLMVPMRDGTKLSVYLFMPEGKGPWPVLYEQRYALITNAASRANYAAMAAKGYVVAAQNFRGAQLSEGVYTGYRALSWGEQQDGYDTVMWLAKQPWSTGKIGTFGGSQAGYAQNFLAVTQPPNLVAQYMTDTGQSLFHLGYRRGGTTRKNMAFEEARDPRDAVNLNKEMFRHPVYDEYWKLEDTTRHFDKMNVPCFTLGSWYDFMNVGSIESYIGRQHHGGPRSRGKQHLLIGPWLHGSSYRHTGPVGDIVYPENSIFPVREHMIRWFDHYLKGIDNGVEREPVVRYYVMGAVGEGEKDAPGNQWRDAPDWPVPARETAYYLHGSTSSPAGSLSMKTPTGPATTTYNSDPANPAPIPGRAFPGARDAREHEKHPDVRTFTTDPLTEPVEWTGKVRAELFVSSTAPDADFIVRVTDVYPDGRSILIIDGIRRARFRDSWEKETLMKPGEVYKIAFDVGYLSQVFNRGHRIRVSVASTGAPFYHPNPQTGERLTYEPAAKIKIATETLHHKGAQSSRIFAPVFAARK